MVLDQRNQVANFANDLFRSVRARDPDIIVANPLSIVERLGRPERRAPGPGHLPVLLPEKIVDAGLYSLPSTEPVIRVMGEGDDKALVEAAVDDVIEALTKVAA